jgi:pyruvate dehydrogenase E2 component (dihydrolipoamide acetyltransferase)
MDVRLPNLGEGVDSGSVVTLFVKEGDVIAKGQTILELENEKAVAPIPSPAEGRVTGLRVKPGDKISVGQVLLTLAEAGAAAASAPTAPAPTPEPKPQAAPEPGPAAETPETALEREPAPSPARAWQKAGVPPPAAPSVRKLAKDLGIDLTRVRGSEAGGRIVLPDLRAYIQRLQQIAFQPRKEPPRAPVSEPVDFSKWGPVSAKPMSPLRQVISRRLVESWTTIPHVTQFDEADITRITELRKNHAPAYESKGTRLTVTSFLLKAVVAVLKKNPVFNASIDEAKQSIVFKEYFHIGLAVDTDAGLMVPVIRDVDTKSVFQLSKDVQDLADKARDRKLTLEDMKGGTFTISNQGGIGSAHFTPIINKPEAAILGVGRAAPRPAVTDNQMVPRLLLPLALSYDHRLIDGAQAARFMVDLVAALEGFNEDELKP